MALLSLVAARYAARQASEASSRLASSLEGDLILKCLHAEGGVSRFADSLRSLGSLRAGLLEGGGRRVFTTGTGKALAPYLAGRVLNKSLSWRTLSSESTARKTSLEFKLRASRCACLSVVLKMWNFTNKVHLMVVCCLVIRTSPSFGSCCPVHSEVTNVMFSFISCRGRMWRLH